MITLRTLITCFGIAGNLIAWQEPSYYCREFREALFQPKLNYSMELVNGEPALAGALVDPILVVKNEGDRVLTIPDLSRTNAVHASVEQKISVPLRSGESVIWRETYASSYMRRLVEPYSGCTFHVVQIYRGETKKFSVGYRPQAPWNGANVGGDRFEPASGQQRIVLRIGDFEIPQELKVTTPRVNDLRIVRLVSSQNHSEEASFCNVLFLLESGSKRYLATSYLREDCPGQQLDEKAELSLRKKLVMDDGTLNYTQTQYLVLKKFDLSEKTFFRRNPRSRDAAWGLEVDGKFLSLEDLWRSYESEEAK